MQRSKSYSRLKSSEYLVFDKLIFFILYCKNYYLHYNDYKT